jgi:hypothetical protein
MGYEGQMDPAVEEEWMTRQRVFNAWWSGALKKDELARKLRHELVNVPAVRAESWPEVAGAARRGRALVGSGVSNLAVLTTGVSDGGGLSTSYMLGHFRSVTDQGAAGMLLGARVFAARHGRLPAEAAEMAEEAGGPMPRDRFSAGGERLKMRVEGHGVTVWSVGENGVDDGGKVAVDGSGAKLRRYGNTPRSQGDVVYGARWRDAGK